MSLVTSDCSTFISSLDDILKLIVHKQNKIPTCLADFSFVDSERWWISMYSTLERASDSYSPRGTPFIRWTENGSSPLRGRLANRELLSLVVDSPISVR